MSKYTIKDFYRQYSNEQSCLDKVFKVAYGDIPCCPVCQNTKFKRVKGRKCYQCSKCRKQLYPCKGTIFEKSDTPLYIWFYAIFLFSCSKNGLSAKELQRLTGVSYKTAWRMLKEIRKTLTDNGDLLSGIVEADETYIGGKNKNRHYNKRLKYTKGRSQSDKIPVFGMLQRGGTVKAGPVLNVSSTTLKSIIVSNIKYGSNLMTDGFNSYNNLESMYNHKIVYHNKGNYVTGNCHTNSIENFWSVLKRTIKGSYICVSGKYMQYYVNECVFKFNHRNNPAIFGLMVNTICSFSK